MQTEPRPSATTTIASPATANSDAEAAAAKKRAYLEQARAEDDRAKAAGFVPVGKRRDLTRLLGESVERTFHAKCGRVPSDQAAKIRAHEEQNERRLRIETAARLRGDAGLWKEFEAANIDDTSFVAEICPDALPAYCKIRDKLLTLLQDPGTVFLRGGNGPGKSHLASALVNRFCDLCRPARYATTADFFREYKSTFGEPGKTQTDLVNRFRKYELLALDEYEVRSESKWEETELRQLIDARHSNLVATVLITNLSFEDLQERLPRAVRDRMRQRGDVLECDWGSLRKFGRTR